MQMISMNSSGERLVGWGALEMGLGGCCAGCPAAPAAGLKWMKTN